MIYKLYHKGNIICCGCNLNKWYFINFNKYKRNGRKVTVYDFAEVPYVDKTYKFYKINPKL